VLLDTLAKLADHGLPQSVNLDSLSHRRLKLLVPPTDFDLLLRHLVKIL